MPDNRYPKRMLYGQLSEGTRPAQGPKKRYKDQLKQSLKSFNLDPTKFEEDTFCRTSWRTLCHEGMNHFEAALKQLKGNSRDRKDAHPVKITPVRMLNNNNSTSASSAAVCAGRGLFSHRRTHEAAAAGRDRGSVIIDIDGLHTILNIKLKAAEIPAEYLVLN